MLFVLILIAAAAGFGWWYLRQELAGNVTRDTSPSWNEDSTRVIFSSEVNGKTDLFTTDLNGRTRQQVTETPDADEGSPAYSVDGKQIAFDSDREGNFEIYVMQADGLAPRRLTNNPAKDLAPSWAPDGQHIVFMSARDNPSFDIYRMDANGGHVERLTKTGSSLYPQVSPNGSQIALHVARDIHVLDLKTMILRRITHEPLNGMHPTWSSDGDQIAFMTWRNGRTEIFTAKSNGTEQQLLVSMPSGDAIDPRWSPHGNYVAFVHAPDGGVANAKETGRRRHIYIVDVRTKRLTRLSR